MKPSDIILTDIPLTNTFQRFECECAAALIIRACQVLGDEWKPITLLQIEQVIQKDVEEKVDPWVSLLRNPFFFPDMQDLVRRGFAICSFEKDCTIELSPKAIVILLHSKNWRKDA